MRSSAFNRLIALAAASLAIPMSAAAQVPLIKAVKAEDRAAVTALLKERAEVNARAADGTTALYWAAAKNDFAIGTADRAGADVKAASRCGVTPLQVACLNGNASFIELLLKSGADANAATPAGETALMTASRIRRGRCGERASGPRGRPEREGKPARTDGADVGRGKGHSEAIKALLERGADLRARSNAGWTPLLFAAQMATSRPCRPCYTRART